MAATALGVPFRDTDSDVVTATGRSIDAIFREDGEDFFRILERRAVQAALATHSGVLSLGGGAILDPGTQSELRVLPSVVFLSIRCSTAIRRTELLEGRPLTEPELAIIERRVPVRLAIARGLAALHLATDDRASAEVLEDVLRWHLSRRHVPGRTGHR
jgi:shikimate kinase